MDQFVSWASALIGGAVGGGALVAVIYRAMRDRLGEDFVRKTDFVRIEATLDVHTEKIESLRISTARIEASQNAQTEMLRSLSRRINGR